MSEPSYTVLAEHAPDDLVVVAGEGSRTCEQLLAAVHTVELELPAPEPEVELLISCASVDSFAIALLAAWNAGHTTALPPNRRPSTLESLRSDPRVGFHLHDEKFEQLLARPHGSAHPLRPIAGDRMLATVYTSGSTELHRRAHKTARQLLGEAEMLAATFGVRRGARVLATVPPHHIYGLLFGVLVPLMAGAVMVDETPLLAESVAASAQRTRASVLVSTPAHLRSLATLESGALADIELVFSSGAALHHDTAAALGQRHGLAATEILGSTETGGIGWRRGAHGPTSPWRPLPGVAVSADDHGRLLIDSPFCAGERGRPTASEDRIELAEDGTFLHLGRIDDVVKVGGKRLSLGEQERRLLALDGVADAAVVAEPSEDGRGTLVRAVVVAPDRDPADLRDALSHWYDPVLIPRRILCVDRLPREQNGKLVRERVRELFRHSEPVDFEFTDSRRLADESGAEVHEVDVRVPRDLVYFRGHFPGHPVLPGVAQLEGIVLVVVQRLWPELGHPTRLVRLKFKHPIGPGETLRLRLDCQRERSRIDFVLYRAQDLCASGSLRFA